MNDDFYWSASAQAIAFGDTETGIKLEGAPYAVFDTGTPYIFAPPRYYDVILEEMVYQAGSPEVIVEEGVSFVDCKVAKQFKPFYMMFSEYWVEVQPEEYIWDANGD